ncbi:plasmid mobilization protein [Hymenobacter sp. HDW8]|uniref:plasmid mobilization protein n=1 Tax=Hymenobacter sp. HDW8 TaxID=2714932 RepID=UPI00140815CC|nr:plasmid mobilization relaxosome protein MobC [Hymenobacter sp. HDW8]QIL78328.1 mobilization protein [Hymenobacter sp. HDW8]
MENIEQNAPAPKPKKEKVIRFRATADEVNKIEAKAARAGLSCSAYCRRAALDKPLVELVPPALRRQISVAGHQLNQLTRLANAGQLSAVRADRLHELLTLLLQTLK